MNMFNYTGYNNRRRTPIFTSKKIMNPIIRAKENERIWKMIDEIGKEYGNINNPIMIQILIHSEKCPSCRESLPLWKSITSELKRVLPTYNSLEIEFEKESKFNGMTITGAEIYEWFGMSGIPFVIQNFDIVTHKTKQGKKYNTVKRLNKWIASYEGTIHPYGFLSKIFKIKNKFLSSLLKT